MKTAREYVKRYFGADHTGYQSLVEYTEWVLEMRAKEEEEEGLYDDEEDTR